MAAGRVWAELAEKEWRQWGWCWQRYSWDGGLVVVCSNCMVEMGEKDSRSERGNLMNGELGVERGGVVVSGAECC